MGGEFKSSDEILKFLENDGKGVKFIHMFFPDLAGELRGFEIPSYELEGTFREGKGFDGSSIEGFIGIEKSDLVALPEAETFRILPWNYEDGDGNPYRVGCIFCDIMNPDGSHSPGDARYVLKRTLEMAKNRGFSSFKVGPEIEFFYFTDSESPSITDNGKYFSTGSRDPLEYLRKNTALGLLKMGIVTEYAHHEVAPSQHEMDFRYADVVEMADTVMLSRYVIKEFARMEGVYATFMPKPLEGENGNGMHVHQSLWRGNENVFFDENGKYYLSDVARSYIAGIMKHIAEVTSILNQWVNSFKRLVPGYEAPVYIAWGQRNRSALVRIPEYKPGMEKATRIELRSPDPGCNPYLSFSVMLAAGLRGVEEGYELQLPYEGNIYAMPDSEKAKFDTLPGNLDEALELTRNSPLVRKTLGDYMFEKFIEIKDSEIERYRKEMGHEYDTKVSPFEIENMLPIL